jgi:hypothetical protein
MRMQHGHGMLTVASHAEIDALVGELIMHEAPSVHWEDSYAHFRFETLEEALDAMRDPVIQGFIPADQRSSTVLEEVREFRPYSTMLLAAWELVEHLRQFKLHLRREGSSWIASFADAEEVTADSASLAISLAALRFKGITVELEFPSARQTVGH